MTMDEMYKLLREAEAIMNATPEEAAFNEVVIKSLVYLPDWSSMARH